MDKRVMAIAKLGYKKVVVPVTAARLLIALKADIEIFGCRNLKEVISAIFSADR
jgi:DNA repair protein RadA/Sms